MYVCMYVHIFVKLCIYVRRHAGILFSNFNLTPAAQFRCQDIQCWFLMYKMAVVDIFLHITFLLAIYHFKAALYSS